MKLLFADKFPDKYLEQLRELGHDCEAAPELSAEDLSGAIGARDGLVVRSTRVTEEAIAAGPDLRLIIRAGAGTNTIDVAAATSRGVLVCNVPGRNAVAVAELAFGLIVAIDRNIPDNVAELRAGRWDKTRFSKARGLYGRNLGIVGLGGAGMALAERAAAFGMELYALDKPRPSHVAERAAALGIRLVNDMAALARTCDVLSFHVPLNDDTHRLVDRGLLAEMKPGSIIINTSRGDIVDADALIEAMDHKGLRAGIDVFPDEPTSGQAPFQSDLASHPNVYGTAHIGASTDQAQLSIAEVVVEIVRSYEEGAIINAVNPEAADG